jgi:ligand-binding sensor protein
MLNGSGRDYVMKITDFISKQDLQKIQDQFSDATGLAAITVDANGDYMTSPSNFNDFCIKYTRGTQEGLKRCIKCDTDGVGCYFCHAGLMDFSAAIVVDGQRLGAVVGGQVLPEAPDYDKFRQIAKELGIQPDAYIEALKKVPIRTEKSIRAAAGLLSDLINKVVNLAYLEEKGHGRIGLIEENVKKSLDSVASINEKTKYLQNVASRQNILTLNATIESARAGDAGRGFSVVASQMGDLSRKSADIYKGITEDANAITKAIRDLNQALS